MTSTTILVPLDGSELAERALPYAERLARGAQAKLVVARAAQAHTVPGTDPTEAQVKAIGDAERYLDSIATRLRRGGLEVESASPYGPPAGSILDEISIRRAGLVVMTSHGRSGLGRLLFGSVADQVLRRSPAPVLVVPADVSTVWPEGAQLRVLVMLDGSTMAEQGLAPAAELATWLGAALSLVRIVEPPDYGAYAEAAQYVDFDGDLALEAARAYLEQIGQRLRRDGRVVEITARLGDPVHSVVELARERGAAAIAMTTRARSGIPRLVLGSVATGTIQHAPLPVLVVHPTPRPAEAAPPEPAEPPARPISASFTAAELELLRRGLDELLYRGDAEPAMAASARELQGRISTAQGRLAEEQPADSS